MPYVICARCSLRTYSAALWTATDVCPSCGAELPRRWDKVVPIATHPRFGRGGGEGVRERPDESSCSPPAPETARLGRDSSRRSCREAP